MKWFNTEDGEFPEAKDMIMVKLVGCKMDYTHAYVYVRDGEGLGGWFNEWRYATDYEKQEFGKTDCAYLKEKDKEDADVAQLIEHPTCNRTVGGLSPSISN